MKKLSAYVFLVILLSIAHLNSFAQQNQGRVLQGTIWIKLKPSAFENVNVTKSASTGSVNTGIKSLNKLNSTYNVTDMKRLFPYSPKFEGKHMKHGLHLWYELTVKTSATSSANIAGEYSKIQEVEIAEPVYLPAINDGSTKPTYITKSAATSETEYFNDPYLKKQWHYNNTGQTGGIPGMDINLYKAWEITKGTPNVIVSIHDQGVDYRHEDLADMMWVNEVEKKGTVGVDDDGNGYIDDVNGFNFSSNTGEIDVMYHGTHVAGTVAAHNDNGIGVSGVAGGSGKGDGVRIMTCEILGGAHAANIPLSYVYAADNGAVISQNSWGYSEPGDFNQAVDDAIDYFIAEAGDYPGSPMKGGVVIFAAGNSSTNEKMYPAANPSCISVAAIDATGNRAPYSNYGTWVSIAAPGGDADDDVTLNGDYSNGIMSTLDNNGYGYLDGTSMACPHVSGVAGLVVSKYGGDGFTNDKLKNHLLTGVRDTIYKIEDNARHPGELGAGLIDAKLALANDNKIVPDKITNLQLAGIAQDFGSLTWEVPDDEDDEVPLSFEVIYSKNEIDDANLQYANILKVKNSGKAGETFSYEVENLQALTTYHFAVRGVDRWGNVSGFSNIVTATTNSGPVTSFTPQKDALNITIDVTKNTVGRDSVQLFNTGEGILKWDALPRHKDAVPLSTPPKLSYPVLADASASPKGIISSYAAASPKILNNIQEENWTEKGYVDQNQDLLIMGETNTNIPNSSATRFYVDEENGFNLTFVDVYLNHDESTGPVILEIYEGSDIANGKLLLSQEVSETSDGTYTGIKLDEQLFFETGKYFWIVFHIPAGNKFPLGAGLELHPDDSKNCYMSLNGGKTWNRFEDLYYDNQVVWAVFAMSQNAKLDQYVTLNPYSGKVNSGKDTTIVATVDGSNMINGTYKANLAVFTNETGNTIHKMPVNITIKGQKPVITSTKRVNFGNVLIGNTVDVKVVINNTGLGRFNFMSPYFNLSDPQFSYITGLNQTFEAKTSQELTFRFKATKVGNNSCIVEMLDEKGNNYSFELFAAGIEPPVVKLEPKTTDYNNISIGDTIKGQVFVKNAGNYPLDYYLPSFADGSNMESVPTNVHKFGYSVEQDTIGSTYVWNDISKEGTDVTPMFSGNYRDNMYKKFPINFLFPFFGKNENFVYITKYGLLSFTEDNYLWSISPSFYKFPGNPDRYISGCSFPMLFEDANFGKIYYKQEPDKFIVQYEDVPFWEGYYYVNEDYSKTQKISMTFQIVLNDNGNIDLYYKDNSFTKDYLKTLLVAIEDKTTDDGLLISGAKYQDWENYYGDFTFGKGTAIHIKNPGLGLFTNVTNPYGSVMPHDSVKINYQIKTANLSAIPYNENLVIITNDPVNNPAIHTANINITTGGKSIVAVDKDRLDFGTLFKGTETGITILVTNKGNAIDSIKSAAFDHDYFTLTGDIPSLLKPERQIPFVVKPHTLEIGDFADTLRITTLNGQLLNIGLSSKVILGPVFNLLNAAGTTPFKSVTKFLNAGNNTNVGFKINNPGSADLKVAPFNNEWASITETVESELTDSILYKVEKSNVSASVQYDWIDVVGNSGIKVEGIDTYIGKNWSEGIQIPFPFKFYGISYDTLYIGNGLVTFTKDQNDVSYFWGGGAIPQTKQPNNFIAPLFVFGGPDYVALYPQSGIYYQLYDDKVVVEYHDYNSNFTMGPPISFEVILYPSGNIKFQYKMPEDGNNTVTSNGVIGIENAKGTDGVQISYYQNVVNSDMAIGLYPARSYTIPSGEAKDFNLLLDAKYLVEGSYLDSISFVNNDPYILDYKLPAKVVVTGAPKIEIPDSIDFGLVIINPDTPTISKSFEIKNTGSANFTLSGIQQRLAADVKIETYIYANNAWIWQELVNTSFPVSIPAKSSLKLRATLTPESQKTVLDTLLLNTSLTPAKYVIPINANIYSPAVISLNTDTITCYAQTEDYTVSREKQIGNGAGGYKLDYKVNIVYQRENAATSSSTDKMDGSQNGLSGNKDESVFLTPLSKTIQPAKTVQPNNSVEEYNRILSYESDSIWSQRLGYNGARTFYSATGFVAPASGFNLTHVQNWFIPGDWLTSKIKVMVLAGDNDINNCTILISESFDYNITEIDDTGSLLTHKLSTSVEINPGEKFFVVFGFEAGLTYPQGCIDIENNIPNRYLFGSGAEWYDLSAYSQFSTIGWMVRAIEETANDTPWVVLTSADNGTLEPAATDLVKVKFTARTAKNRNNYATLMVESNDIVAPVKKVVLHLIKNSGSVIDIPANLKVNENDTLRFKVVLTDLEGDNFTVKTDQEYEFLKIESTKSEYVQNGHHSETLNFIYTPDYECQGTHLFGLTSIDEFNNETSSNIEITVTNMDRWPEPISQDTLKFKPFGNYKLLTTEDLFSDPDHDLELLEGSSGNADILNLYNSGNSFLLMPQEAGETSVTFMATDKYGAQAINTVHILVSDNVTAAKPVFGSLDFAVYPNPTKGEVHVTLSPETKGDVELSVVDMQGRMVKQKNFYAESINVVTLDISELPAGLYFIKMNCNNQTKGAKIIKQ
jgi:subtilisin family serine protease